MEISDIWENPLTAPLVDLPIPTWFDSTLSIGLSFIFLAYYLHPKVHTAFHRVRAYRAWRAIEKRKAVEVTDYPTADLLLGRQGSSGWDAARIVAILILVFNLASWLLELSLDLYALENTAYLLTKPPPVFRRQDGENSTYWQVLNASVEIPDFGKEDEERLGIEPRQAKSLYHIENFKALAWSKPTLERFVKGEIVVADWNEDDKPTFSYGDGNSVVTVTKLDCIKKASTDNAPVKIRSTEIESTEIESTEWGVVRECEEGPARENQQGTVQPAILLTKNKPNDTYDTYVIVEETAEKRSFLYSVWIARGDRMYDADADDAVVNPVELEYEFHIESTVRLAEAVVTGIVNAGTVQGQADLAADGKSCFRLLREYSQRLHEVDFTPDVEYLESEGFVKAKPFGENPKSGDPVNLQDVETIEAGVGVGALALGSFVVLVALSFIGIAWARCLKKSTPIDVYDRDELIRAVSLQGQGSSTSITEEHSAIRIFVRKEDTGTLTVVVSDAGEDDRSSCLKRLRARGKNGGVIEAADPAPVADTLATYNDGFGGVAVPVGPRTVWLGGVRTGMGRSFPGREGNFRYPTSVALSASPVPSEAGGSIAGTPVSLRSPVSLYGAATAGGATAQEKRDSFSRGRGGGRRGASVFFDSVRSFGSGSSRDGGDGGGGEGGSATALEAGTNGRLPAAFGGDEEGEAPAPFDVAMTSRGTGATARGEGGSWRSSLFASRTGAGSPTSSRGGSGGSALPPSGLVSRRAAAESLASSIRRGGGD